MLLALRSLWESGVTPVIVELRGTPRKRPLHRPFILPEYAQPPVPAFIADEEQLSEEEFLLLISMDLD